jgi:hypothetical protein
MPYRAKLHSAMAAWGVLGAYALTRTRGGWLCQVGYYTFTYGASSVAPDLGGGLGAMPLLLLTPAGKAAELLPATPSAVALHVPARS